MLSVKFNLYRSSIVSSMYVSKTVPRSYFAFLPLINNAKGVNKIAATATTTPLPCNCFVI